MIRRALVILAAIPLSAAAADAELPLGAGSMPIPAGWSATHGACLVLRAPGGAADAARLTVAVAEAGAAEAAQTMRDAYRRVTDGCEVLDDDEVPLGGRVWRRLRVRFATGPVLFGQSAWIGPVGSRTVVAVLSAPDERLAAALPAAAASVAGINAPR